MINRPSGRIIIRPYAEFARDIKIEHSLFALPFAFVGAWGAVLTGAGALTLRLGTLILLAMVFARTAAMGYNRWLDADIDARNPRTRNRAIPSRRLPRRVALGVVLGSSLLFWLTTFFINSAAFLLAPAALVVILGYSWTKRFTSASHLILGLALGLAPAGGWLAVTGTIAVAPVMLALAVLFWVAGFDILYALQDIEFDRSAGLFSVPSRFGERKARVIAAAFHLVAIFLFWSFGFLMEFGATWLLGVGTVGIMLIAQHFIARNRARISVAFFHLNAGVGFVMFAAVLLESFFS